MKKKAKATRPQPAKPAPVVRLAAPVGCTDCGRPFLATEAVGWILWLDGQAQCPDCGDALDDLVEDTARAKGLAAAGWFMELACWFAFGTVIGYLAVRVLFGTRKVTP